MIKLKVARQWNESFWYSQLMFPVLDLWTGPLSCLSSCFRATLILAQSLRDDWEISVAAALLAILYALPGAPMGNTKRIRLSNSAGVFTEMTQSFRTDRSRQTVQTQIRLLLEEGAVWSGSSMFAIIFAPFWQNIKRFGLFVWILGSLQQTFLVSENLVTLQ